MFNILFFSKIRTHKILFYHSILKYVSPHYVRNGEKNTIQKNPFGNLKSGAFFPHPRELNGIFIRVATNL